MARPASGTKHIDAAKELLRTAKTANELRRAQAVLLPLTLGFSMQQTAVAIGRSVGATCSMRTRFLAVHEGRRAPARSKRELRNRASTPLHEEARVLDEVFSGAAEGQVLVVPQLKPLIDQRLGKALSLSSIYRMLARHGWRKLSPDTAHPQGDALAREDWKKKLCTALDQVSADFPGPAPLRLMFQDEARFGRISDCRRCCCRRPVRPLVQKMISRQYTYVFGAVSPLDGQFDTLIRPRADTSCMQLFPDEVAQRHSEDNIVMVLDGAGWHTTDELAVPSNMRLLFLPPYSPELNPVEHLWDELREKHFHNRVFSSLDAMEQHLLEALMAFEGNTECIRSICAWPWIINSVSNAN